MLENSRQIKCAYANKETWNCSLVNIAIYDRQASTEEQTALK